MNHYLVFVYGVCFALIGGAAFAMMWANIRSITTMNDPIKSKRHPEAPAAGEDAHLGFINCNADQGLEKSANRADALGRKPH